MDDFPTKKNALITLAAYFLAVLLTILVMILVLKLWRADLYSPFCYNGDHLDNLMVVKCMITNGWCLHNDSVGAPGGLDLHDFPYTDNLDLACMKVISWLFPNCVATTNIYYLLTFPLTAITSLFVFRRLRFSYPAALLGSQLFTFAPFHMWRGEHHLFIAPYYVVPLIGLVIFRLFQDRLFPANERVTAAKLTALLVICVLVSCAMPYYAFFGCYFLLIIGSSRALSRKSLRPLMIGGLLSAVIFTGVLANLSPNILFRLEHGVNPDMARQPCDAEWNGMKICQLLWPVTGHRFKPLAQAKTNYNQATPLVNENDASSLGALTSIGFVILIVRLLWRRSDDAVRGASFSPCLTRLNAANFDLLEGLGTLLIFAVLLGTVGGFGSLFNWLISPWVRCYNRVSIYIAFFSLLALIIVLEELARRWSGTSRGKLVYMGVVGLLLAGGIWDQTCKAMIPPYRAIQEEFAHDADFFRRLEASVPPRSLIYQIPLMTFPEGTFSHRMYCYDHLRGYIHSRSLRWTYGAMRGRPAACWQQEMAALSTPDLVTSLCAAGCNGIYIDRWAFVNRAASLEMDLTSILHCQPLESASQRYSFFKLTDYNQRLAARSTRIGQIIP